MICALNFYKYRQKIFISIFILLLIFIFYKSVNIIFPVRHLDLIKKYAHKYNLNPNLICAIIHTESKFNKYAISNKNASGLMQIKKSTADWAAKQIGIKNYDYKKIFDPEINIQIGCWYINNLLNEFKSYDLAICAYNAGSGNVTKWLKKYSHDNKILFYIPFKETRLYLRKIKLRTKIYKLINFFN